jgi:long-chain acyl-CoA synthetase
MTDGFRWHPQARLFTGSGREVRPLPPALPPGPSVVAAEVAGLVQVIGSQCFRIGGVDQPAPEPGDQPVFETLTAGSTGTPRRIRRTQASWIASFAVNARLGVGPGARVAVLGQLVHSLPLYGAIEALHLGADLHFLANLRPDRQSEAIAARGTTHLYASPAQLRLLTAAGGRWPNLQRILVGGSKLDATLRGAIHARAPQADLLEFYGAAETSFVTLADRSTPPGSVGRAFPGVAIMVDPSGEIWVKSPYLFAGYAGDPGAARWRDGWLSVGEMGRLEGGDLTLHGRAGRMVTIADQNVFPEAIEAAMLALPGITQAAVLPVADPLRGQALVAVVQGDRACEAAILAALRVSFGALKAPKALIWQDDWPILGSGKTDLKELEARVRWPA